MHELPVEPGVVERVASAMATVPRPGFLPPSVRHLAGADLPVGIGWDATCSQPSTVARMLVLLDARAGHRVLDVGSGSGWTTAILATLGAAVTGVELVPQLVEMGRAHLRDAGVDAAIEQAAPGVLGLPSLAPFDRILVSADLGRMPDALVDQLAPGGRLVAPVAGSMVVVDVVDGSPEVRIDGTGYAFVPLRD
ncbi:protein-L-isoaspartate O-methyltransferase family protein [Agrococcus terreus]|uniref:Protein-L-isoaspartate O-methyltransferase n=1 Tax=Agrococcus terreus TaxID=574649 RepID=A0ABQ2K9J4_9MICO|nr:protein-L-isoaspartate O-methyltransferase [Agrococcus terreus]GGN76978.1 fibrillarin-like rRNA methylase [Agrococcus terreus]